MKRTMIAVLSLTLTLTGCARLTESRLNPVNWFGRAQPEVLTQLYAAPQETRPLIAKVTDLRVEAYPGGAIVTATGLPPTDGYWQAELVGQPVDGQGRLVFEFRVTPPTVPAGAGTTYTRQITAATTVSTIKLQGVASIVVQGADNSLSSRR
jgi:hypothetical protein